MDIVANWLALLPEEPREDEFGRPWAVHKKRGLTPAQARYYRARVAQDTNAPAEIAAPAAQEKSAAARPPMVYKNGAVDDKCLYAIREGRLRREPLPEINNIGDLLALAFDRGLDTLWVAAETKLSERATPDFMDTERWEIDKCQYPKGPSLWDDGQKRATFVLAWKKKTYRERGPISRVGDQGRAIHIGYAEHETSYGFDTIKDGATLLAAVTYLEDAIGAPVRFSAQSTGKYTMREAIRESKHESWAAPVTLPAEIAQTMASDCVWRRDLTPEEIAAGGFLLTGDKNSQYMAAATSAMLGEGEPEYMTGEEIAAQGAKLPTGVYKIRLSGESLYDGNMLPHPTNGQRESWQWVYTVMLARDLGYSVEIVGGYVWRAGRSHTTLRSWADKLWAARAALKTDTERYGHAAGRQAAYEAINTIIRGGMGLLDHPPEYGGESARTWYRPDWYALLIDLAKCKMFYVIEKYRRELGKLPLAVYTDCLYYLGATDDHPRELPGMFDRSTLLGGFKRKYERPVTVAQLAPLFTGRLHIQDINLKLLAYDRGEMELKEIA